MPKHLPVSLLSRCSALSLLVSSACTSPVWAASPNSTASSETTLQDVVVQADKLSDTDERRYATASKIVFGREELDKYGDSTVGETLKRLPGVTLGGNPGRGGEIRMRGLGGGYTLILLNGEPMPRGFSLDSLSPEQIERIEIMRSPVAEYSARAIAGTINIVLREKIDKRSNEARPSLGMENGRFQPGLFLQRSDQLEGVGYSISANTYHRDQQNEQASHTTNIDTTSGLPTGSQQQTQNSRSQMDGAHLGSRIQWALGGGDSLILQPFISQHRSTSEGSNTLEQSGSSTMPAPYATSQSRGNSTITMYRLMSQWKTRLEGGSKLELKANLSLSENDSQNGRRDYATDGSLVHTGNSLTHIRDTGFTTSGKYSQSLGGHHALATGWELETGQRHETASNVQDGVNVLAREGDNLSAQTQRIAGYLQDEWDISPLWAVYGGLRWEGIHTESQSAGNRFINDSHVLSPMAHSVWRLDPDSKDQIRLGLARTYRAPGLNQLVAIPNISNNYPVSGGNTANSPDQTGNPNLKPELAWGLDLAYEHYLPQGGLLSASVFYRDIDNLIRNLTTLQTVSWSSAQRWVSMPTNVGHATSRGIELESKFKLEELFASRLPLDVRANYSYYWSSVDDVPGPNNRLDQQPRQTANLGLDYRAPRLPLTVGGNLHWIPAYNIQQSAEQASYQGNKRVVDVYALWKFDRNLQLRLSAANWLHADALSGNSQLRDTSLQQTSTINKTYRSFLARLEIKF